MVIKPNIRSALRWFLTRLNPGIAIGLMVFALSARHLDMNTVFTWLGPQPVYADGSEGGGGDHDGGDRGGDHDGGDRGGDRGGDHDSDGSRGRDNDHERGSGTDDHGGGNDPADIGSGSGTGNGPDQTSSQFRGLEGVRDLTPLSNEEEAGLVGNWGSPARNGSPEPKP